jgi:hypothetical protein
MRRLVPLAAAALGLLWFLVLSPAIVRWGDARWRGQRGPNLNDLSVAILSAAKARPGSWPSEDEVAPLVAVFEEAGQARRMANACGFVVGAVLQPDQREALPSLAATVPPAVGSIRTDPELHQALADIMALYGVPWGEGAGIPGRDPLPGVSPRDRARGLRALIRGDGPGLTRDQAEAMLPACLEAELAYGDLDHAGLEALPPMFLPYVPSEPGLPTGLHLPPSGVLDDPVLTAAAAVLRGGPELLSTWSAAQPRPGPHRPPPGQVAAPPGAAPQPGPH